MHKPESVLENEPHKDLRDVEIETDHLILNRRPDLILINKGKRIYHLADFVIFVGHWVKMKEDKTTIGSCESAEKTVEHSADGDSWNPWNDYKWPGKETGETWDQMKNRYSSDHRTVKIRINI